MFWLLLLVLMGSDVPERVGDKSRIDECHRLRWPIPTQKRFSFGFWPRVRLSVLWASNFMFILLSSSLAVIVILIINGFTGHFFLFFQGNIFILFIIVFTIAFSNRIGNLQSGMTPLIPFWTRVFGLRPLTRLLPTTKSFFRIISARQGMVGKTSIFSKLW